MLQFELDMKGVLYSFTEVHAAPSRFPTPFVIGYVDLPDDLRLLAQAGVKYDELLIGQAVTFVPGRIGRSRGGDELYSYVFVPRE